jgi:hypothetical protein
VNTWAIEEDITVNRRTVSPDTELAISQIPGRFRFIRRVTTVSGRQWIDVYGGTKGHETIRSFHPDRIKTVHRSRKMRRAA